MGTNKARARAFAQEWWKSEESAAARVQGGAVCDKCLDEIRIGEGYLCNPQKVYVVDSNVVSTPDLVCEKCFDGYSYEPWNAEQQGSLTVEQVLFGAPKQKKKRWQFWR